MNCIDHGVAELDTTDRLSLSLAVNNSLIGEACNLVSFPLEHIFQVTLDSRILGVYFLESLEILQFYLDRINLKHLAILQY